MNQIRINENISWVTIYVFECMLCRRCIFYFRWIQEIFRDSGDNFRKLKQYIWFTIEHEKMSGFENMS